MRFFPSLALWLLASCCTAFRTVSFTVIGSKTIRSIVKRNPSRLFSSFEGDWQEEWRRVQEETINAALVRALVAEKPKSKMIALQLRGRSVVGKGENSTECLFLSEWEDAAMHLAVPLPSDKDSRALLLLLAYAYLNKPISKSLCLVLNSIFINRDGGLFDNLPWKKWSIDPQKRNYDAANNPILEKYHMGKRDAYNIFMGKDWKGRSYSIGNLALRLKYLISSQDQNDMESEPGDDGLVRFDEAAATSLAKRILEVEIRETKMEIAGKDQELAVANTQSASAEHVRLLEEERRDRLEQLRQQLETLQTLTETPKDDETNSALMGILDRIAEYSTNNGENAAPYRGAIGYAPLLDSVEDVEDSILPYTSPYDLLQELIQTQLNADVIGAVLENTSWLQGNLVLGGALILKRRIARKTVSIDGEEVLVTDEMENFGNEGVQGGVTMVVECEVDEAIGMALTCKIPISVEGGIWGESQVRVKRVGQTGDSVFDAIPLMNVDENVVIATEGEAERRDEAPIRAPRTTMSLFEGFFSTEPSGQPTFPTDNPIQSLAEYDSLSNAEKAKTLMTLSNFQGKLPRPRLVRQARPNSLNPLDQLLLPMIDESVRRQVLLREAKERNDDAAVEKLQEKSARQIALENAEGARELGFDGEAERWEKEADFYGSLRADVTQDEGSYSRFLDQDDWYERNRRNNIPQKSQFGSLLDGIE